MKNKYIFIILIIMILIPIKVNALNSTLSLSCPSSINSGENITCVISGNASNGGVSGIKGTISFTNAQLVSFTKNTSWEGGTNASNITLYTGTPKYNSFTIANVVLKPTSISSVTLTFNVAQYSDENDNIISGNSASKTITVNEVINNNQNTNNNQNLGGSNNVPSTNVPNNNAGNQNNTNNNIENGSVETVSNDSSLKKLVVNNKEITIDSQMTIKVPYSIDTLKLDYETNDSEATVEIINNLTDLQIGDNKITLKVTAKDQTSTNYELNIIRLAKKVYVNNNTEEILSMLNEESIDNIYLKLNHNENNIINKDVLNKLDKSNKNLILEFYENDKLLYTINLNNNFNKTYTEDIKFKINYLRTNKELNKLIDNYNYIYFYDNNLDLPSNAKIIFYINNIFSNGKLTLNKVNDKLNKVKDLKNEKILELDKKYLNDYVIIEEKEKSNSLVVWISVAIILVLLSLIIYYFIKRRKSSNEKEII